MNDRPVLVVEDDYDVRDALQMVLEDAGHRVVLAQNGLEALELLRSGIAPRLILLDLMMPVMDGFQFRAAQRAESGVADIPVIILTADRSIDQKTRALAANGYLAKPIGIDELLAVVDAY